MSDLAVEVGALRRSVGLSRGGAGALLRFEAEAGLAALATRVASPLELREGQFRQALALDDSGRPAIDLTLGVHRGVLHVFAEALGGREAEALGAGSADEDHVVFGLDGPFAWEVLAAWDTQSAIGLPYLSAYSPRPGFQVVRAGRTGEYGYLVVTPREQAEAVWAELRARVEAVEGAVVGAEALRHCSLENWVFDIRRDGVHGLDALELQLTWRLDLLRKEAVGLDALRAHRERGLRRRITAVDADGPVTVGDEVRFDGAPIGAVISAAPRLDAPGWSAVAALDLRFAHAGLSCDVAGVRARTRSAPFVLNRSLFVNPQRHAWATRTEIETPPHLSWSDPK